MPHARTGFFRHADLHRLLHPASIAVVGASTRAGSFGERVLVNLADFAGPVHAVNPRYERIGDRACHPSLAAIGAPVDCVVIAAAREAVEPIVRDCAEAGVGGAIVFASGYAETGKPDRRAEQDRLTGIARGTGLRIVGPNTIGLVNAALEARATFMTITPIPPPGRRAIGIVSQSGALGMSLAQGVARGASVSHVLTSGNSCDVDMADYIAYLAEDPACAAIACVFEGTSEPGRILDAAAFAAEQGKPLVVYKMATGSEGAAAAMSHTGALAGTHEAYRAAFRRAGAVLVEDYERLLETASFFAKAGAPKASKGIIGAAVLVTSGGAGIMAADAAERHGVPLPQPDSSVRAVLESHIPEFGAARNPCDVTAQVIANPESLAACAGALLGHPDYAALVYPQVYSYEATAQRVPVFGAMAAEHGKPVCMVWITEFLAGPGAAEAEAAENVALFRSMSSCFAALAAWTERAARLAAPAPPPMPTPPDVRAQAAHLIAAAGGRTLTEREAKAALALYGVPVVGERLVQTAEEAVAAAEALGTPAVLKVESPDLPHKTEAGVIRLGLGDAGAVRAAFAEIMARAGAVMPPPRVNGVLVQPMVPAGVELVVGARIDPLFGPLVVVGLGGVLVEVLADTALALAPVSVTEAEAMLGGLRGARLLDGFRGAPAVDRTRLAEVIAAVSRFAADHRDAIAELDVNPLIGAGERIVAVDALIVPRRD